MQLNNGRKKALKIILLQVIIVVTSSMIWMIAQGWQAGYSALLGGAVCVAANLYFVYKVFAHSGAQKARQIMQGFYIGELVKLLITASLFGLIFYWGRAAGLPVFLTYIAAQLGFWFAPIVAK